MNFIIKKSEEALCTVRSIFSGAPSYGLVASVSNMLPHLTRKDVFWILFYYDTI